MGIFYSYYGMIGYRDPYWPQRDINFIIRLFRRLGLMENLARYNTMICQSRNIFTGVSEEAFSWRIKLEGATYQERLQWRITCPYCQSDRQNILHWYMRSDYQPICISDSVHYQGVSGRLIVGVAYKTTPVEFTGGTVS